MPSVTTKPREVAKLTGFFDLPIELRHEIYRLCVPTKHVFDTRETPTFRGGPSPASEIWYSMVENEHVYVPKDIGDFGVTDTGVENREEAQSPSGHSSGAEDVGRDAVQVDLSAQSSKSLVPQDNNNEAHGNGQDSKITAGIGPRLDSTASGNAFMSEPESKLEANDDGGFGSHSEVEAVSQYDSDADDDGDSIQNRVGELCEDESESESESESNHSSMSHDDPEGPESLSKEWEAYNDFTTFLRKGPADKWAEADQPHQDWIPTIRGLLLASRQLREEVLDVLYGENVFRVFVADHYSEPAFKRNFSQTKRQRLRHIMLVFRQRSQDLPPQLLPLPELFVKTKIWNEILPNLTTLRIVAMQPYEQDSRHVYACWRNLADQIKRWNEEVPQTFRYLKRKLSPSAVVLADIDGRKITGRLIKQYLRSDWRPIRTTTGDIIFDRDMLRPYSSWAQGGWTDQLFDGAPTECECETNSDVWRTLRDSSDSG